MPVMVVPNEPDIHSIFLSGTNFKEGKVLRSGQRRRRIIVVVPSLLTLPFFGLRASDGSDKSVG